MILHPPYSPDLAPADFFLFPKAKGLLAGTKIQESGVKNAWQVVSRIKPSEYSKAFDKWLEIADKWVRVQGNYVEK